VLTIVSTINLVDRQILSILAIPIKQELALSNLQVGMLTGLAFALFYAAAGIPMSWLADRYNRALIITVAFAGWSAMTVATGASANFLQLFLARMGVGLGETGTGAPALSLISEIFPPQKRASALAYFTMSVPLGALIGQAYGGFMADIFGWRVAFICAGLVGLLLAPLVLLLVPEPRNLAAVPASPNALHVPPIGEVFGALLRKVSFRHLTIGVALLSLSAGGQLVFVGFYLREAYHLSLTQIGVELGLISGLGGALGTWLSGQLSDRLRPYGAGFYPIVAAAGHLCAVPIFIAAMLVSGSHLTFALLFLAAVFNGFWYAPIYASLQGITPVRSRSVTVALFMLIAVVVGYGIGPVVVGRLTDYLISLAHEGNHAVACVAGAAGAGCATAQLIGRRFALIYPCIFSVWGICHLFWASRTLARDTIG
jgi:predicted MFS family arabinose efflux permease